jgi:hypothetical protein
MRTEVTRHKMQMCDALAYRGPDTIWAVFNAVCKRDHALLQQALADKQCVDQAYGTRTPMYILLTGKWHDSNPEILRTLLKHGANPELRAGGGYGTTPLVGLATNSMVSQHNRMGWMQMIQQLLDMGVDLDTGDWRGTCILAYAAEHGDIDLVKLMVDRGADVDNRNWMNGSSTPLMMAVYHGNLEIARFLAWHGASVSIENNGGYTALDIARDSRELFRIGINGEDFALELQNISLELKASRNLAVAMGLHPRLGDKSLFNQIDHEMLHMFLDVPTPN